MHITLTADEAKAIAERANLPAWRLRVQQAAPSAAVNSRRPWGHLALVGDVSVFSAFLLAAYDHLVSSSDWPGITSPVEVYEVFGTPLTGACSSGADYRWPNVQVP